MKQTRQTALLVLLITSIVVVWGSPPFISIVEGEGETPEAARVAQPMETSLPTTFPDEVANTPEPEPTATMTPTKAPAVEPTATLEPTAAPEPTPRGTDPTVPQRPEPPEQILDQSLIVERGSSGRVEVALTFDAGEGDGYTTEILDLLDEHGYKGSFGITGEWARQYPELVQRMVDEGHMIFNHSETHRSWTGASSTGVSLSREERIAELDGPEEAMMDISGYELKPFYRPPYGDYDLEGLELLKEQGYDYTLWWTCDSLAWNGLTPEEIVEWCGPNAEGRGGPGAIILMHVAQEADYLALEGLIAAYEAEGYDLVTMEEMIQP